MKRLSIFLLVCFMSSYAFADSEIGLQQNFAKKHRSGKFDKSRLFVGGGIGGGSLQGGYAFSISPTIGYQFTNKLHAGVNLGYLSSRQKIPYANGDNEVYKNTVLTASLFARYFIIPSIFIQARPEVNLIRQKYTYNYASNTPAYEVLNKYTVPSTLVGAGYAQRLGGNSYLTFSVMYDLIQNPNSPYYRQPVFGGGLALGLFGN